MSYLTCGSDFGGFGQKEKKKKKEDRERAQRGSPPPKKGKKIFLRFQKCHLGLRVQSLGFRVRVGFLFPELHMTLTCP